MDILNNFDGKINGVLQTFDRMLINGYLSHLFNYNKFLYYLIQNDVKLKYFKAYPGCLTKTASNTGCITTLFAILRILTGHRK